MVLFNVRKTIIITTALFSILFLGMPSWAESVKGNLSNSPSSLLYEASGVLIEAPPEAFNRRVNMSIENTSYSNIVPNEDFYVSRSVDLSASDDKGHTVGSLAKPIRIVFSIDDIDHKRAAQMNTSLSLGHFRIGFWNEDSQEWTQLTSQVFWNEDKNKGAVEAEIDRVKGRFALLWSNNDEQLSPVISEGIRILVNFVPVRNQVSPYIKNGRIMVPLRVIAERLGAQVDWNNSEKRIDLVQNMDKLQLWIGKSKASKNNESLSLDVEPEIVGGSTFIPLRFVAEAFGAEVSWDDVTNTAKVIRK